MKTVMMRNLEVGTGAPKIIVPITGVTATDIIEKAQRIAGGDFDAIEWRIDFYEDVMNLSKVLDTLTKLREALGDTPILFTFRTKKEGGERSIEIGAYKALCLAAANSEADAIDVEIFTGNDVVREIIAGVHAAGKVVVGSSHDFDGTPSYDDLLYRMRKMQDMDADLPKLAVMPKNKEDVLTLLTATQTMSSKYADRPIITMSMAPTGVLSRLCGEVFGSAMTFGAIGQTSAPGQINATNLKNILEVLHNAL